MNLGLEEHPNPPALMIAPNRVHDSLLRLRTCPMKTVTLKKPTASSKLGITLTSPETAVGANSLDVATVVTALSDDGIAAQTDRSLLGAELLSVNGTDVYSHDHGTKLLKSSLGRITLRVQPPLRLQEVNLFKPAEATKLGMTLSGVGAPKVSALSADGLAAKAGQLEVGSELLSVNSVEVFDHEQGTMLLKAARGAVRLLLRVRPAVREVVLFKPTASDRLGITLTSPDGIGATANLEPIPMVPVPEPAVEAETVANLVKTSSIPTELELLQLISGHGPDRIGCVLCAGHGFLSETDDEKFRCPITLEVMVDPVRLAGTGKAYERSAIEEWLATSARAPLTNEELTEEGRLPCYL